MKYFLNNEKRNVYECVSEFVSPLLPDAPHTHTTHHTHTHTQTAKFVERGRGRAQSDKRPDKSEEVEFFLKGNKSVKGILFYFILFYFDSICSMFLLDFIISCCFFYILFIQFYLILFISF